MEQIGRYKIERELGRGAMGVVFLARDPAIGRQVVIKTIRITEIGEPSDRARLRDRLLHEARSAGILSHPGIVTVYDVGEQGELAYIAMEFVNGPTLEQLMSQDQALTPAFLFRILKETAAALDYAHKKGIVHRDIKPANIMIQEGGAVKITDFGIAKIPASQLGTQPGLVLGTPSYMSPEQALGRPVDGRSDQFSLAVIAFEMLTGEKPFTADEVPALVYKIAHELPPPAHSINPTLAWPVDVVLKRALEKGPAARYSTCTEFVAALEAACQASKDWKPLPRGRIESLPTVAMAPASPHTPAEAETPLGGLPKRAQETPRRRTLVVALGSSVLTLALIAVAVLYFLDRGRNSQTGSATPQIETESSPAPRPSPAGPPVKPPSEEVQPPAAAPSGSDSQEAAQTAPSSPAEAAPPPAAKPSPAPPPKPVATQPKVSEEIIVTLGTSPPGATVILNGDSNRRCITPCALSLPPGRYTAAATLPGYRTGLRIFSIPDEPDVSIPLARLTGQVQVVSNPPGAAIFVNGQRQNRVTPATLELPVGKHVIAVSREGYARDQQEIEVKDNAFLRLNFTLAQQ